jgi:hypothetical protein
MATSSEAAEAAAVVAIIALVRAAPGTAPAESAHAKATEAALLAAGTCASRPADSLLIAAGTVSDTHATGAGETEAEHRAKQHPSLDLGHDFSRPLLRKTRVKAAGMFGVAKRQYSLDGCLIKAWRSQFD